MTCEVAVANRLGLALAADSAVTFTNGRNDQATYASGANKIFQLAGQQPVAVMVYNGATLGQVPWELVLKSYRKALGGTSFPTLAEYVNDLIEFINDRSERLLPPEVRQESTLSAALSGVVFAIERLLALSPALRDESSDAAQLQAEWPQVVQELTAEIEAAGGIHSTLSQDDLVEAIATHSTHLASQVGDFLKDKLPHLAGVADGLTIAQLGIRAAFAWPDKVSRSYTGVVVAGYGVEEYMPSFVETTVFGFVGRRLGYCRRQDGAVNYTDKPSLIEPFARRSMIETFTQGASPEVWKAVRDAFLKHASAVCSTSGGPGADQLAIQAAVQAQLQDFTKDWSTAVFVAHLVPLLNVVVGLNIEELAELAETLVMLESLKEKVTSRTQGVGGPIDVAIITKSEGLVWIKRKHYFKPELNQRYFLRLQSEA